MATNPFAEFATPAADNPFASFAAPSEVPTGRKLTREELIAQIPGEDGKPVPKQPKAKPSALTVGNIISTAVNRPLDILEVPLAVGANMITGAPIYLSGGMPEVQNWLQENIAYQPRGQLAQETLNALGKGMEATKLPPYMPGMITAPRMVSPTVNATRYGKAATKQAVAEIPAVAARTERLAQEASTKAWERAPQIEAARKAPEYGIALDPSMSNPTISTQMGVGAVGQKGVQYGLSQKNLPKWNEAARKDLGLPANTPLDEAALNKYMERNSTSKLVINEMGALEDTSKTLSDLDNMLLDPKRTSDPGKFEAVNAIVDRAKQQVADGLTGSEVLDQVRGFRNDAKRVLQNPNAGPNEIAVAQTKLKLANTFENLIESNLTDPSIIDLYRKERTAQAKGYDWERAIDPITKQVDPNQLAADVRNGVKLTGTLADLAEIAGAYPEIASMRPLVTPDLYTNLRRGGAGGTIGFATLGGPAGAAVGAGITSIAGRVAAKRIAKPEFQQKYAVPADKRLPLPPVEGMSRPDFVMQGSPYVPAPPAAPITAPNRLLGAPSAEGTMGSLAAERARANRMAYSLAEGADVAQAAAEAAARRPTSGEILFDLDPITGRLVPASQGIKGATPETFSNFGSALETASNKVTAGKRFDLTAAEKVAWEKTKIDLAEVAPGFKALTDKAIAEKMLDRAWVEQTAAKARQQAAAFEQIAARAADERARQAAFANRERMLDLADQMEETLRAPRPVSTGGQGPKTREFQRNRLAAEREAKNRLMEQ